MNRKSLIAILGVAAAALALPAAAQMRMPSVDTSAAYAGITVGQSKFKFDCPTTPCDDEGTAWKFFGGYQFHPNVAAEVAYSTLGESTFGANKREGSAWELSAVGSYPIDAFAIYGRLGLYSGKIESSGAVSGDESKTGVTWGIGGQVNITRNLSGRVEWQRFNKMGGGIIGSEADVDVLSVGALWKFR